MLTLCACILHAKTWQRNARACPGVFRALRRDQKPQQLPRRGLALPIPLNGSRGRLSSTRFTPRCACIHCKVDCMGLHTVSINLSQRITLEMQISEAEIVLINVGSHDAVYG